MAKLKFTGKTAGRVLAVLSGEVAPPDAAQRLLAAANVRVQHYERALRQVMALDCPEAATIAREALQADTAVTGEPSVTRTQIAELKRLAEQWQYDISRDDFRAREVLNAIRALPADEPARHHVDCGCSKCLHESSEQYFGADHGRK